MMELIKKQDRERIENKYHPTDGTFNPHARFAFHGYDYDPATGLDDNEMAEALDKTFEKYYKKVPNAVVKARLFETVLDNCRIDVNGFDWFVGVYNWGRPLEKYIWLMYEDVVDENGIPELRDELDEMNNSGTSAMWIDFDHVVPDWNSVLDLGFSGIISRAEEYRRQNEAKGELTEKQKGYYDSIIIEYTAALRLLDRFIDYAKAHPTEKSEGIINCLSNLKNGAPKNTYDALQMIYIYFMLCESVERYQVRSLGHGLDYSLYPFFKKDMAEGNFTKDEIRTFVAHFLMQFSAIGNYWGQPMWLGGTDSNGNTLVNELSYLILEVYGELNIYNPKIQIRYNRNTPEDFTNKVLELIRRGNTSFLFAFDPNIAKALMSNCGTTYEEAIGCDISGCSEMHVRRDETCMGTGYINAAKVMVYVFTRGYDSVTGKQIGLKTPPVEEMESFDEFYSAFLKQWAYIIDKSIAISNKYEPLVDEMNPSVMHSGTMTRSLKTMLDGYSKAPKYNTSSLLNCAFGTAVDSVLAVKELVFNTNTTTLAELKAALLADWVGYEELREKAINCRLKYGNDNSEADRYAFAMATWYATYVTGKPNGRGGFYKADMHSARQFIVQGQKTEATPDGRKMGDEYSKNVSPVVGADREGATALINSVAAIEPTRYSVSCALDVMIHPSAVEGEAGLMAFKTLIDTFMEKGGLSMQFNLFDVDTLRDAQKHPEKYPNLQVRISGWNALWNSIPKEEQDAYILRASKQKIGL